MSRAHRGPEGYDRPAETRRLSVHSIVNWLWAFGALALVFAWYKARYVNRQDTGTERMAEIASFIREGAIAFLKREYSVLAVFAGAVAVLLFVAQLPERHPAGRRLLPRGRHLLGAGRRLRDAGGHPGQRPGRGCGRASRSPPR